MNSGLAAKISFVLLIVKDVVDVMMMWPVAEMIRIAGTSELSSGLLHVVYNHLKMLSNAWR